MSTFKQLQENVIAQVIDPSAACMATTLDRALNALVENQEHNPSATFQADYYNLERLRTVVRALADGPQQVKHSPALQPIKENIFTIDTSGPVPVWHYKVEDLDDEGNEIEVPFSFNPQPLIELLQKASFRLINEHLSTAYALLSKEHQRSGKMMYLDAADIVEQIQLSYKKGEELCLQPK
jgi:hypothetical protein